MIFIKKILDCVLCNKFSNDNVKTALELHMGYFLKEVMNYMDKLNESYTSRETKWKTIKLTCH